MFTTDAPAKINLDLRILAVRADGYHDLRTLFAAIDLADTLTLAPADGPFAMTCDDPALPLGPQNLAVRGALTVAAALDRRLDGWRLHLTKRVPAEAGLGGGSADAVAAARLVLAAFGASWSTAQLADALRVLGADVAFFVTGGTALGRGIGDALASISDPPSLPVVIARPDFGVATRDAYAWFDAGPPPPPPPPLVLPGAAEAWPKFLATCRNDLEAPVVARHPALGEGLERLTAAGALLARMSGSGSALFGVYPDDTRASAAATGWPEGWRVWQTTMLGRTTYAARTAVSGPGGRVSPLSDAPTVV